MDQLIAPLPRGVPGRALIEHLTPLAHFADPTDILTDPDFAHDPSKIFLGVIGEMLIGAHLDSHMRTCAHSRKRRNIRMPRYAASKRIARRRDRAVESNPCSKE